MDRRELGNDIVEALLAAMEGWQANVWTALPGKVIDFDPTDSTCSIQCTVQMQRTLPSGEQEWISITPLVKCPLVFLNGGGALITYPVKEGDEALVVFGSRCIDGWWQTGQVSPQVEIRMHDLSDGFVIVGPRSKAKAVSGWSTSRLEIRNEAGDTKVTLNPTSKQITLETPGNVTISAGSLTINAPITHTGTITSNGKNIGSTHTHGGVSVGGSNTGAPT